MQLRVRLRQSHLRCDHLPQKCATELNNPGREAIESPVQSLRLHCARAPQPRYGEEESGRSKRRPKLEAARIDLWPLSDSTRSRTTTRQSKPQSSPPRARKAVDTRFFRCADATLPFHCHAPSWVRFPSIDLPMLTFLDPFLRLPTENNVFTLTLPIPKNATNGFLITARGFAP